MFSWARSVRAASGVIAIAGLPIKQEAITAKQILYFIKNLVYISEKIPVFLNKIPNVIISYKESKENSHLEAKTKSWQCLKIIYNSFQVNSS